MRRFLQKDKGNALILGALSFAVLAAFGVLTIDVGRMYVTHNQLQNAADAAALAGASMYCSAGNPTDDEVKNRAILIGQAHKALAMGPAAFISIPPSDVTISQPAGTSSHRVDVTTKSTTQQYFLRLLNAKTWFAGLNPTNINGAKTGDDVFAVAAAQCGATCGVSCIKPWSPPDRWDDVTPIPGYNGGKNGNWANNGVYDQEDFTDTNGNSVWDPGEPYDDKNGNGKFDSEAYSPTLTGYVPDPVAGNSLAPNGDLGLEIQLHMGSPGDTPAPGQYQSIDLPPINRGNPVKGGSEYRDNIANCNSSEVWPGDWLLLEPGRKVGPTNQGMRDLVAQDPNAYWDPITQSVQGSAFAVSPRIVLIPMYDPRIAIKSGRNQIQVTKVAAFFMEQVTGQADVKGRFLKVRAPGEPCVAANGGGGGGISFTYSMSLIR